jgi:hypothetical protein
MSDLSKYAPCAVCKSPPKYMCGCKEAYYCSEAHREIDWDFHQHSCTWVDPTESALPAVDGLVDNLKMWGKGYPGWLMIIADKPDIENHVYIKMVDHTIVRYGERNDTAYGMLVELPAQKTTEGVVRAFLDDCNVRLNRDVHDPLRSMFTTKSKSYVIFEKLKYSYAQGRILLGGATEMFGIKLTDEQLKSFWTNDSDIQYPTRGLLFIKETRVITPTHKQKGESAIRPVTVNTFIAQYNPKLFSFYVAHVNDVDENGKPKYVVPMTDTPSSLSSSGSPSTPTKPLSSIVDKSSGDESSSSSRTSLIKKGQSVYDAAAGK